jgi:hypothetical protein
MIATMIAAVGIPMSAKPIATWRQSVARQGK